VCFVELRIKLDFSKGERVLYGDSAGDGEKSHWPKSSVIRKRCFFGEKSAKPFDRIFA
jgi:hypothetical protein